MHEFEFAYQNKAPDMAAPFAKAENLCFLAGDLVDLDAPPADAASAGAGSAGAGAGAGAGAAEGRGAATVRGVVRWLRHGIKPRLAFNQMAPRFEAQEPWEFPAEYPGDYDLPFRLDFVTPRTIRLRFWACPVAGAAEQGMPFASPMLAGPVPTDAGWTRIDEPAAPVEAAGNAEGAGNAGTVGAGAGAGAVRFMGPHGGVRITRAPFRVELLDRGGRLLTRTVQGRDAMALNQEAGTPLQWVRATEDLRRFWSASWRLAPGERIYGGGESFTRLDKRGQRMNLFTTDAHGTQGHGMYKPVPFFLSDRGYGLFLHTGAPITADLGHENDGVASYFVGDERLDLFLFLGGPKAVLGEYTALTGRAARPPLWSFGLWMSRITYKSEAETRAVAARLREETIPCDVIHLDTGWFEKDWRCDYRFSASRFDDPAGMIADLKADGFQTCLWQLPYFTPNNPLFAELIEKGYALRDPEGRMPVQDAVLDMSNPEAVAWYQERLRPLLAMGVGAIKADFGEGAPLRGAYASGASGWLEHNLYPLRYNQAVAEVTRETTGETILWARSAWAGSQRYPLHWGGDAENTDGAMLASLRGGLSLGLSGFSFWSHDIGGFAKPPREELYRRWLPFGMLTSHSRCHGAPPKEPWPFGEDFTDAFRAAVSIKYCLMPYIWSQATACAARGLPLLRPLFLEYPQDPGAWTVEDAYLLGRDLLVAPLFEAETNERRLYLPAGDDWYDLQHGTRYGGGRWYRIQAGEVPVVLLARSGAAIPCIHPEAGIPAHTGAIDWTRLLLAAYGEPGMEAMGLLALPEEGEARTLCVRMGPRGGTLEANPWADHVAFRVDHNPPLFQ